MKYARVVREEDEQNHFPGESAELKTYGESQSFEQLLGDTYSSQSDWQMERQAYPIPSNQSQQPSPMKIQRNQYP
jgi:hypothetical protein